MNLIRIAHATGGRAQGGGTPRGRALPAEEGSLGDKQGRDLMIRGGLLTLGMSVVFIQSQVSAIDRT